MKRGTILGVTAGLVLLGVVSVLLKHKVDKDTYGLDNDDFADDDFDFDEGSSFIDDECSSCESLDVDDLIERLDSLSDDELAEVGILDRSAIDFNKLPISILSKLYMESDAL